MWSRGECAEGREGVRGEEGEEAERRGGGKVDAVKEREKTDTGVGARRRSEAAVGQFSSEGITEEGKMRDCEEKTNVIVMTESTVLGFLARTRNNELKEELGGRPQLHDESESTRKSRKRHLLFSCCTDRRSLAGQSLSIAYVCKAEGCKMH